MPARTGCCCKNPATLYKVDASGNVLWTANYYEDFGSFTPTNGVAVYSPQYGAGIGDQDDNGYVYQVGGPSIPVDPNLANTQPPVDVLRQYDSNGVKQWGWSAEPTGWSYLGTRQLPRIPAHRVSGNGTSICYFTTRPGYFGRFLYGVSSSGSTIWNYALPLTTDWRLDEVGTNYAIVTAISAPTYGDMPRIIDVTTGATIYDAYVPPYVLGTAVARTVATVDRADNVFMAYTYTYLEQDKGSAAVSKLDVPASVIAGTPLLGWTTNCLYIRVINQIQTDGNYVAVGGYRFLTGTNLSYSDTLYFTEIFDASTGARVATLLRGGTLNGGAGLIPRHGLLDQIKIGNNWITYSNEAWKLNIGGTPVERPFKIWSTSTTAYTTGCGRISSGGDSCWGSTVPMCSNSFNDSPSGCTGGATYTSASDGMGGFVWVAPANPCSPGCFLPQPVGAPTSLSDTFTTNCVTGISCGGHQHFVDIYDNSSSRPPGSPTNTYTQWAVSGAVVGNCSSPCVRPPVPSMRPMIIPGGTPGLQSIDVECM
ncbi:hypothetical protein [Schlesneria paludicola]|uniref:hypothetical protein n=1 Tax=Schlesneria paludicola TaxID=360056 RepID=UPI00029B4F6A|nr:hypothetical protein [Schlesneria paludicola]